MKLPHPLAMLAWAAIVAAPFAIAAGVIALLPPVPCKTTVSIVVNSRLCFVQGR